MREREARKEDWISACAGMTGEDNSRKHIGKKL